MCIPTNIQSMDEKDCLYLIVCRDPIYYFFLNDEFNAVMYTTTSRYNEQWIDYYTNFDHEWPDIILVDKYIYPEYALFKETDFGSWVSTKYSYEQTADQMNFYKLKLANGM